MEKTTFSFKKLFQAAIAGFVPIMLLVGVLAYAGHDALTFNGEYVHGIKGFSIAILLTPVFAFIVTVAAWLFFNFGGYLFDLLIRRSESKIPEK